ncbi:uncharacterized protein LOC115629989 isoform X2 [Scaptodrosophila lebanonensis]|uniref:Uncharacterized protein LOC115629989 isoform X2 n=1 Tax=Drosophila lebanonensis TaxID=7225 RepID=A0A6J2U271_DROLE|nr:uncharacterized protein LOC115629989 isoform X2 [Scaptodrosophila lebanonensis]
MEEINKILQQGEHATTSSSESDSEIPHGKPAKSSVNTVTVACKGVKTKQKKNGSARLPTRRPDPNVYNRNAILARENRRKKKAYLEAVEKELDETRNANRSLLRALKKQLRANVRLEKERNYLKKILDTISNAANFGGAWCKNPQNSETECEPHQSHTKQHSATSWSNFLDDLFADNTMMPTLYNNWNELPDQNSEEHNYFKHGTTSNYSGKDGTCFHIAAGTISLDFCPSCQCSSNRVPPMELLQDSFDHSTNYCQ